MTVRIEFKALSVVAAATCLICSTEARSDETQSTLDAIHSSVYSEASSPKLALPQGYFSMMPLDFQPGTIAVGNPDVLGMEVRYVNKQAQLHLLGQSVGSTNLVVFDTKNKPRVSIDVTVGPPIGNADRIAVYRGTKDTTVYCSLGRCANPGTNPQ